VTVQRVDLEASLGRIRAEVSEPAGGIAGRGSVSWKISREGLLLLGGGRAALLQLAHPFVAQAVDDHSRTQEDVRGRFQRTFTNVYAMTFGSLDDAFRSARRVHTIHTHIRGAIGEDVGRFPAGTRYEANDPESLLWVYATLVDTSVQVYELVIGRLSAAERDQYLAESHRFAALFGIPPSLLPGTWAAFESYVARMLASDTLAVGTPARTMGAFLMAPPSDSRWPLQPHRAAMRWYATMTAALLPARFREAYGLSFGPADRAAFQASVRVLRLAHRGAPRRLRHVPAYVEACARGEGREGPDRVGRLLERAFLRAAMTGRRPA
jgi:uncharacterized protein (DUF2236 family)